ncbi:hypothetical protein GLOIN_2v1797471 [Rhizophagus clarus]|uniref:Uncharacterized protein n=1 Tax=Rhizophagus clarus TaxID=94130 RepID=A0A8H3M4L0_9GLOM|nr:hypothetical protein GLOIN_2v1797471 [Rhizophagus clarus]
MRKKKEMKNEEEEDEAKEQEEKVVSNVIVDDGDIVNNCLIVQPSIGQGGGRGGGHGSGREGHRGGQETYNALDDDEELKQCIRKLKQRFGIRSIITDSNEAMRCE